MRQIRRKVRAVQVVPCEWLGMKEPLGLGVALSIGEQTKETYRKLMEAGAHRYLLRIESSNKKLYSAIHPHNANHSFETRVQCLKDLRDLGYQFGTGVMVGLPGQTIDDLANDVLFFQDIGMRVESLVVMCV